MKLSSKAITSTIIALLVLTVLILIHFLALLIDGDKCRPPLYANIKTFPKEDEIISVRRLNIENVTYFEVKRHIEGRGILELRSGPPSYIFATGGQIVDWVADRGESRKFASKWGVDGRAPKIDIATARSELLGVVEKGAK